MIVSSELPFRHSRRRALPTAYPAFLSIPAQGAGTRFLRYGEAARRDAPLPGGPGSVRTLRRGGQIGDARPARLGTLVTYATPPGKATYGKPLADLPGSPSLFVITAVLGSRACNRRSARQLVPDADSRGKRRSD